jgi:hypothetical protein
MSAIDPMPTSGADIARSIGGPAAQDAELTHGQGIELSLRNFFHNDEGQITTAFPRHSGSSA